MLHAFSHKKSRLYRRYLGHRDETTEQRVAEEDEITSTLMGPLAFLSPAAIATFWGAVVRHRNPEHAFPTGAPTHAEMEFWPRSGRIEPDLLVTLTWGAQTQILLVEFKWRAPLSGDDQLHIQWEKYLDKHRRDHALHLFIGLDTSAASNALNHRDCWKGKLIMRSWFDILDAIAAIPTGPGLELQRWIDQVRKCLKLMAVEPFNGFEKNLTKPKLPSVCDHVFFAHPLPPQS
ncbi:hypothetical protein [Pseudomonas sp. MYb118]|uniref:hypothetical protein n=1 Tax=Pseudomonas sp. MYb118 TaxID=1848720 RepID=UPI0034CFDB96